MTTPQSLNQVMVCRDCGLDTAVSHANTRECVEALQHEWRRLAKLVYERANPPLISQPIFDPGIITALSPRLRNICEPPPAHPSPVRPLDRVGGNGGRPSSERAMHQDVDSPESAAP
jgi:hypothetical protein